MIVKFLIARMKKIHDEHWSEFWDACVAEDERRTALVLPATVDSPTGSPTALTPPSEPEPANDAPSLIDDYQALSLEQQVAAYAWIMAGRREKDPDQECRARLYREHVSTSTGRRPKEAARLLPRNQEPTRRV